MINSVGWRGRVVLAGIEHEAEDMRLIKQRIVALLSHEQGYFSTGLGGISK